MHTIGRNSDGTWWVGRQEVSSNGSTLILVLFDKMSFSGAVTLCNCLNGGAPIDRSPHFFKAVELCAVK